MDRKQQLINIRLHSRRTHFDCFVVFWIDENTLESALPLWDLTVNSMHGLETVDEWGNTCIHCSRYRSTSSTLSSLLLRHSIQFLWRLMQFSRRQRRCSTMMNQKMWDFFYSCLYIIEWCMRLASIKHTYTHTHKHMSMAVSTQNNNKTLQHDTRRVIFSMIFSLFAVALFSSLLYFLAIYDVKCITHRYDKSNKRGNTNSTN